MHSVYLVDDDKPVVDSYLSKSELFAECGFSICGAETTPMKALEDIRELRPDVVISDLKMPSLSGMELFALLQADEHTPLFVIVSAYKEPEDIRGLFLTGGNDYLVKPVKDDDLAELLTRLSGKLGDRPSRAEMLTESRTLNEIMQFLNENPALNHTLDTVGKRFSLNPTTICNLFARYTDTTFSGYLTALRMERAKELLRATELTAKEVAAQCGYPNHFYFTRLFQKTYGKPPMQYRKAENEK